MIKPRLLTYVCYLAMMSLAIGLNLLPVFLTTLGTSLGGLSQEALGKLGASAFVGLVVGIVATGPLVDRWGPKPFALLGSVLLAVSLPGCAFAPDYFSLCLALFGMGLGGGILDMVLSPVVSSLNPENRSATMNWLHSFYCVGAVFTILLGTFILHSGGTWQTACLLLVPLPVILVIAFSSLKFPSLVDAEGGIKVRVLVKKKWFLIALIAIFLGGATEMGMSQWLPAYVETSLGFPVWLAGSSLLLFFVAMTAGRMVIGLMPRTDPFVILAWSSGTSVICFLLGAFLPVPSLALVACILAGFTGSCLWPTLLAVTADQYPGGNASMFGVLTALGNAGGIFMPWVVGWIADRQNLHWGLAVSALAPALLLPLVIWMGVRRSHDVVDA